MMREKSKKAVRGMGGGGDVRGRRELERGRVLELLDQEVRRIGIRRELESRAL